MEPKQNKFAKPLTFAGIIVLVAGVVGLTTMNKKEAVQIPTSSNDNQGSAATTSSTRGDTSVTKYKDGIYTAEGKYISPAGAESVGVSLTIKNDIVVASSFTPKAENPGSVAMQNEFAGGYKTYVVGKNLDAISVGKVSGSSLTPKGFNDAVAKIRVQAKS